MLGRSLLYEVFLNIQDGPTLYGIKFLWILTVNKLFHKVQHLLYMFLLAKLYKHA
jgi:hypothetical protein